MKKMFRSVTECAAAQGLDRQILVVAREQGSPGFRRNGKVEWRLVEAWLLANEKNIPGYLLDKAEFEKWRLRLVRAQALKAERELAKAKEDLIPRAEARAVVAAIIEAQCKLLKHRMVKELPILLVGKSVPEIHEINERMVYRICKDMQLSDTERTSEALIHS